MYLDDALTPDELLEAAAETRALSREDRLIADGACLTCLEQGQERFPQSPEFHLLRTGHAPVVDHEAIQRALSTWVAGQARAQAEGGSRP
jgi:hypothetical protein